MCTTQTALRYLEDFGLEFSSEFLRIVGIVRFAETFRKFPFVLLGNAFVTEMADIQPNWLDGAILRDLSRIG